MLPANTGKQWEHLLSLSATQILLAVSGPVAALLWVASRALQASQGRAACIRSTYPFPCTTERRISYLRATSLLVLFWGCPASSAQQHGLGWRKAPRARIQPFHLPQWLQQCSTQMLSSAWPGCVVEWSQTLSESQCTAQQPTWQLVDLGCIYWTAYVTAHKWFGNRGVTLCSLVWSTFVFTDVNVCGKEAQWLHSTGSKRASCPRYRDNTSISES